MAAAARLTEAGNRVVLDSDGSYIQDKKTGTETEVDMSNGQFGFDIWVKKAEVEGRQGHTEYKGICSAVDQPVIKKESLGFIL